MLALRRMRGPDWPAGEPQPKSSKVIPCSCEDEPFARDPRGVPRTTMERVDGRATADLRGVRDPDDNARMGAEPPFGSALRVS